jgi:PAS domain S-box-containing protein
VEDLEYDAEIVARAIRAGGINCEIINAQNREEFIEALSSFHPEIVLSDHSLPAFNSHEALRILKESGIEVPFILVTATVSEEYAVSIIKEGADDYILKDRLQRLPNAIISAIEKYRFEAERKKADVMLRLSERKYKMLFESNPLPMWMLSRETLDIIAVNEAAVKQYGYSRSEFLKLNAVDLRPPEEREKYLSYVRSHTSDPPEARVWKHQQKDGTIIWMEIFAQDVVYENNNARLVLASNVTGRLKMEEELSEQRRLQQKLVREVTINIQERERQEIGRELHDNINQLLAATKMFLHLAIKSDPEKKGVEYLEKSEENITLAIQEIRKLSHSLVAPSTEETLVDVICRLLDGMRAGASIDFEFDQRRFDERHVEKSVSLMLYRVLQEQVNNIVKHARATKVSVILHSNPDAVILEISDNGIGFDSTKTTGGIGLRNIYNRAEFFDAEVRIVSSPGKGCSLLLKVPLPVQ